MVKAQLDILGVGNAIIDVISQVDDGFIERHAMAKGGMALIDEEQAEAIYGAMGPGIESSGGSAANTVVGVASLGGTAGFIGKVKQDLLGKVFAHDLRSLGISFDTPAAADGPATARCLILVTPDAERTMNTFLGACVNLGPEDIDEQLVRAARVTYLEGYLFDPPLAKEAFRKAAAIAEAAGRKVALSLSDSFCVDRHRDELLDFIGRHVDILFANEDEVRALYPSTPFEEAVRQLGATVELAAVTLGARGSLVVQPSRQISVAAQRPGQLVDTTGAGDLYAAGFLLGHCRNMRPEACAQLGGLAAAEVIGHVGGRPQVRLADLLVDDRRFGDAKASAIPTINSPAISPAG